MRRNTARLIVTALTGFSLSGWGWAQAIDTGPVQAAATKFSSAVTWRESTVLIADFNCTGNMQFAILGGSTKEIVVAMFTDGLDQAPALLRFEADAHELQSAQLRLDNYTMSADEIAGISGKTPTGYRPSSNCHGVRLSDQGVDAAHIYWDHDHRRFDTWTQQ
ncbi:MAG: hypothetical protein M3Y65_06600 [Pseudomonadota bacterium]|nr:hypothetical protein [Pseudomonadota bacterium]